MTLTNDGTPASQGGKTIQYIPSRWPPFYKAAIAILQSTILLAVVTATLFYIGFTYYSAYLGSFADISLFPPLGTSEYLTKAFDLIFASRLIVTISFPVYLFVVISRWIPRRSIGNDNQTAIVLRMTMITLATTLAFGLLTLVAIFFDSSTIAHPVSLSIAFLLMLGSEIAEYRVGTIVEQSNDKVAKALLRNRGTLLPNQTIPLIGITVLFLVVFVGRSLASAAASQDAERFYERPVDPAMQVQFDVFPNDPAIEAQTFRVVLQRGGNYYVVPVGDDGRPARGLFIIPESGIVSVRVATGGQTAASASPASTPLPSP